ncbi:MAG: carbohydrate porin [Bacteroidia bacterium]
MFFKHVFVAFFLLSTHTYLLAQTDSASIKAFFTPEEIAAMRAYNAAKKHFNDSLAEAQAAMPKEESSPFSFSAKLTADLSRNFTGGISQGNTYMGLIDLNFGFNTDSAHWWKGGEFLLHLENSNGQQHTGTYIGDFQTFSNIEAPNNSYLYEIWYRQQLGKFAIKVGKHDLNSEFMVTENGLTYVNSSFGVISSGALGAPLSIYPRTALTFMLQYQPNDAWNFQAAIYDGDPGNFDDDPFNIDMCLSEEGGFLGIAEAHYTFSKGEKTIGTYKIGGYYHSQQYEVHFDTTGRLVTGNWGAYAIFDHKLFSDPRNEDGGLSAFGQVSIAPSEINLSDLYIGFGLNYVGLFRKRPNDVLGLAYAHMNASKTLVKKSEAPILSYESAVELTYQFIFGDHFILQPDAQYIINPGLDPTIENSFVGVVRVFAMF